MTSLATVVKEAIEHAPPTKLAVLDKGVLSTAEVLARTHRIKEIQQTVMKVNVHYGTIPGTPKPTLYSPGADLLLVTFRIAPKVGQLEDLSTDDAVRYRLTMQGITQGGGDFLGEGAGECSSDEEKYRWRRAVCDDEWNETPADRRRAKWSKGRNDKPYQTKQIRTSAADVANTVLKMAVKRAKVAMTLHVTAASDVFAQDLEDLSEELREHLADEDGTAAQKPTPAQRASQQATSQTTPAWNGELPEALAPANVGVIVTLHERGNAALIELNTGFVCSTRDAERMQEATRLRDDKRVVELQTRPSADPEKYAPILVAIKIVEAAS